MRHRLLSATALILVPLAACGASLSPAGERVRTQMGSEAPADCEHVADVATDDAWDPPTSANDARIELRNEAGERGANFLVVDIIESRPMQTNPNRLMYIGTGRAYRCGAASR